MAFRYLLIIVKPCPWTAVSYPLVSSSFFFLYFSLSSFFPLSWPIAGRGCGAPDKPPCTAFIRELNVGHSFFNERFAILISRINLVVSRYRKSFALKATACVPDMRVHLYIFTYIYIYIHTYTRTHIYIFFKAWVEHLVGEKINVT